MQSQPALQFHQRQGMPGQLGEEFEFDGTQEHLGGPKAEADLKSVLRCWSLPGVDTIYPVHCGRCMFISDVGPLQS
jgi:hypothetical protein